MSRLQIGFEGSYEGRGFFRRIFGSGPLRLTPVDVAIADKDIANVEGAVQLINLYVMGVEPARQRIGSLIDLSLRPFVQVRTD